MAKSLGVSRNTVVLAYQGAARRWLSGGPRALGLLRRRQGAGWRRRVPAVAAAGGRSAGRGGAPVGAGLGSPLHRPPGRSGEHLQAARLADLSLSLHLRPGRSQSLPDRRMARLRPPGARARNGSAPGPTTPGRYDDPLLVEQIRRRILPRRGIMASERGNPDHARGPERALSSGAACWSEENAAWRWRSRAFPTCATSSRSRRSSVAFMPVDEHGVRRSATRSRAPSSSSSRRATSFRRP